MRVFDVGPLDDAYWIVLVCRAFSSCESVQHPSVVLLRRCPSTAVNFNCILYNKENVGEL